MGLVPIGLGPRFPAGSECLGIDDNYALDYGYKRSHSIAHGGLDVPAPQDTPILAVAAGTVVGRFQGENTQGGVEVNLRHSPVRTYANTGAAIVPDQRKWMDPHSLYRGVPPFDADQAAKLPEADKWVDIPVMYGNGATQPRDTRLIWPYACLWQR